LDLYEYCNVTVITFLVVIYPVIELKDLIYAHRYGWLNALLSVTNGIVIRPEPLLGSIFRSGFSVKDYLVQQGLPQNTLNRLLIMLDHGINSPSFSRVFNLEKTPKNIVYVYHSLGVDMGIAFDVPARVYMSIVVDLAMNDSTETEIEPVIKDVVRELAYLVKKEVIKRGGKNKILRQKALKIIKNDNGAILELLRELSRRCVEETVKRLSEMVEHAGKLGFKGLVPVVQGIFDDDIEYCARESIEIMSQLSKEFTVAIGTGGRVLSNRDVKAIKLAIDAIKKHASRQGASIKIHLLGWSSPNRLRDYEVVKSIYSADSLSARRRAIEGRIYVLNNGELKLVNVKELRGQNYNCPCPACKNPVLREFLLDPSGARRNDVRIIHNIYTTTKYLNTINRT